eukprot:CAMPEP_0197022426 /NCGR_PEP_ID=MMETSP1384-20130603/3317_1 /TAXON_ID=29189 /ORGANISM="Ammonia sp." /LENGTH=496 /DNA_ID=CAMNT_0042450471 /DNA_START=38 /DNA_END=1528 /DNA_ORIENTATION=+
MAGVLFCLTITWLTRSSLSQRVFVCTTSTPCNNDSLPIECDPSEDCTISCNGESACASSTIHCPTSTSSKCTISCNGAYACNHIEVQAANSSTLTITSSGEQVLSEADIYCPSSPTSSSSSSSCSISYNGHQYGLNDVHLYTLHSMESIDISCDSNKCWSAVSPPILYYGTDYTLQCTIHSSSVCLDIVSMHSNEGQVDAEQTTTKPASAATIVTQPDESLNMHREQTFAPDAAWLVALGIAIGVLLSIFVCFVTLYCRHRIKRNTNYQIDAIKRNNNTNNSTTTPTTMDQIRTNMKQINMSPSLKTFSPRLSPSLRALSPHLAPAHADFMEADSPITLTKRTQHNYIDSLEVAVSSSPQMASDCLDGGRKASRGVFVTVQRYENAQNEGDEEEVSSNRIYSPDGLKTSPRFHDLSAITASPIPLHNLQSVRSSTTVESEHHGIHDDEGSTSDRDAEVVLGINNLTQTDVGTVNLAPGEFIVCGDDEDAQYADTVM